jgi:WD40 repeat protein
MLSRFAIRSKWTCLRTLEGHGHWVNDVAFGPDGMILASASSDQSVMLWDPASGRSLGVLSGHTDTVTSVAFNQTLGSSLASMCADT